MIAFSRLLRMMSGLFLQALLVSVFLGCNKDENPDLPASFPAEYVAERIELKHDTRIFTHNGEIKDGNLVALFDQRLIWPRGIEDRFQAQKAEMGFLFTNDSTAIFSAGPLGQTQYDLERKGTRFVFTSDLEFPINVNIPPVVNNWGYLYHILKYKEQINPLTNKPVDQPYNHSTKNVRVAHGNFKVMKASCFDYHLIRQTSETSGQFENINGQIFNEVEGMLGRFLGARDTLVLKEYSVIFTIQL